MTTTTHRSSRTTRTEPPSDQTHHSATSLAPKAAAPSNRLEAQAMSLLTPTMGPKGAKMAVRTLSAMAMGAVLVGVLWLGHLAFAGFLLLLQVGLFSELIQVRHEKANEIQLPLSRTVQWGWFFTAVFSAYGSAFLRAPLGLSDLIQTAELPFFASAEKLHEWLSFAMYSGVFVLSVLSLKRGCYLYQISQLAWTIFSLLMTTVQMKCVVYNVALGYFWVLFPTLLVVINDSMAYFVGQMAKKRVFGKDTVFLQLSPNKTWEGFLGGGLFTMMFGFFLPVYMSKFDYLTCSYEQLLLQNSASTACAQLPGSVFQVQDDLWGLGLTAAPAQLHGLTLGAFASLVAPFGGFFASAVKRAHGLEDFSDLIPGHGGFMDRLDCQFIMVLCTNVHYNVFVAAPLLPSFATVVAAAEAMTPELRQQLLNKIQGLCTQ